MFQVIPAGGFDLASRESNRPNGHLRYHTAFTPIARDLFLGYICQVARPRPPT